MAYQTINDTVIGMIIPFCGSMTNIPDGFLLCDGTAYNATTNKKYKKLYDTISTNFGGSGESDFNVPDLRGMFLRGWDAIGGVAKGLDPDANSRSSFCSGGNSGNCIGSCQESTVKCHTHAYGRSNDISNYQGASGHYADAWDGDYTIRTSQPKNVSNALTGGNTRPHNVSFLFIIKY